MNRKEQAQFVRDLVKDVVGGINDHIKEGRIPKTWDGVAQRFERSTMQLKGKRLDDYENDVIVRNL